MPTNRHQFIRGADLLLRVGVLGAGLSVSWPIAATVFVGVGGNLVSELVSRGLRHSCTRLGQGHEVVNGDLQRTLEQAYRRAIDCLEDLWWKTPRGNQIQRTDKARKAECEGVFAVLRKNADGLMTAGTLQEVGKDAEALRLLGQGQRGAKAALNTYLDKVLHGHEPDLDQLIRANLEPQIGACFTEELKTESREGNRAWRAYQRLLLDAMLAGVNTLDQKQDQILAKLETWEQRWNETETDGREPTGKAGLQQAHDSAAERIIQALSSQFARSQEETRGWFETTWTLFKAELRASEDRIVDRVLQGIDERLANPAQAAPPVRSRIWDVPHHWSRYFVGRDIILERMHERFCGTTGLVALVQAIQGLGGVGKTQVAVHYAYRHSDEYTGVWWLPAESAANLTARYAALADRLGLASPEAHDQQECIKAVRRYLEGTEETGERWLLIFDNAVPSFDSHNGGSAIEDYLPRRGKCDVLITSREKAWGHLAEEQDVDVLAEDDAAQFLTERTGDANHEAARQLARDLGYLPLALEQAGAFIKESRGQHTLASYLTLFRRNPLEHLASDRPKVGKYAEVVATTWFISFEAIERQSPAASDLLRLCAFLAPERIPLGDLIQHAEVLPQDLATIMRDPEAGPTAISLLLRYSLAETAGVGLVNVHRLVQLVVREWLTDEERTTWAMAALQVIDSAFPSDTNDPRQWEACSRLLAHAQGAVAFADHGAAEPAVAGRILSLVGRYLQERAQYQDAQIALERALALNEAALGSDHPNVATSLNLLAGVMLDQGDLAGARANSERALAIDEAAYGPSHPEVAMSLNNLGAVLRAQGDLAGAQDLLERSLEIREKGLRPNHSEMATSRTNLGLVLLAQGDLAGAREQFERALVIDEAVYGRNHPRIATELSNIGMVLYNQGDLAGARECLAQALAISETVLGTDHPGVAMDLNNLGVALHAQGDLAGAKARHERALAIREKVLGVDHLYVALSLSNLATVLYDRGDLTGARNLLERSLEIREKAFGPNHPDVAVSLHNLASVLYDRGDLSGARARYERAVVISEAALGPNHSQVATSLLSLGDLLQAQGDLAAARQHCERALAIREAIYGPDHPDVAQSLNTLLRVLEDQGNLVGSLALLLRAWRISLTRPSNSVEGVCLTNLGTLAAKQGRPAAGLPVLVLGYTILHRIGYAEAETKALPLVQSLAGGIGCDGLHLQVLLDEAAATYDTDRGRSLVAAAFPEANPEGT